MQNGSFSNFLDEPLDISLRKDHIKQSFRKKYGRKLSLKSFPLQVCHKYCGGCVL